MPKSRKEMRRERRDIARAFSDLDVSSGEPSTATGPPKSGKTNCPTASQPPLDEEKGIRKVLFMTLPVELRLRIYDLLLVSRVDLQTLTPRQFMWTVGKTNQMKVNLFYESEPFRTMEPGILQTCKQIYHEANSMLYSHNVFEISGPDQMFQLIRQIGTINLMSIKRLDIKVYSDMLRLSSWLRLLNILAEKASGLRHIALHWGVKWHVFGDRGLGDDLEFVRALGNIQNLEELVISGYYAKNWPEYLEDRMSVRVRAISACCGREERGVQEANCSKAEWDFELDHREDNLRELKKLREYQKGTDDLIP